MKDRGYWEHFALSRIPKKLDSVRVKHEKTGRKQTKKIYVNDDVFACVIHYSFLMGFVAPLWETAPGLVHCQHGTT